MVTCKALNQHQINYVNTLKITAPTIKALEDFAMLLYLIKLKYYIGIWAIRVICLEMQRKLYCEERRIHA